MHTLFLASVGWGCVSCGSRLVLGLEYLPCAVECFEANRTVCNDLELEGLEFEHLQYIITCTFPRSPHTWGKELERGCIRSSFVPPPAINLEHPYKGLAERLETHNLPTRNGEPKRSARRTGVRVQYRRDRKHARSPRANGAQGSHCFRSRTVVLPYPTHILGGYTRRVALHIQHGVQRAIRN